METKAASLIDPIQPTEEQNDPTVDRFSRMASDHHPGPADFGQQVRRRAAPGVRTSGDHAPGIRRSVAMRRD
jgi:hypothetical protein